MMDKVKLGIIGLGGMGTNHASYLKNGEVEGVEIVAVCDINPKRFEWAKNNLPESVRCFESANELFASKCCDAVLIATPHYDHPPLVIDALNHGLHALSEKPAGVYTKQVREMNEVAAKSDKKFGVMFQQRTEPLHKKIKDLMDSGELGELRRVNWLITNWFRSQSYYDSGGWRATWAGEGGGVLLNQCPHNLDLWQWMCGMPKRIRAFCYFGKYHNIEVDDDVTAYAEYENGATALFVTTTGEAPGTNRLEISGDRGKLVLEHNKLTFYRTRELVSEFNRTYKGGFGSPECWEIDMKGKGGMTGHKAITADWIKAIRTGSELFAPGVEGINGLALSNAMLLSTWTDSWVDLPVDEDLYYEKLQEKIKNSSIKKESSDTTLDVEGTF
jgi:predicted dehydrogenase